MRFLTKEEFLHLSPHVWRYWKPKKYKGGLWWKFEDVVDISDTLEKPFVKHQFPGYRQRRIQFIPFGKLVLKIKEKDIQRKLTPQRQVSLKKDSRQIPNIICTSIACSRTANKFVVLDSLENLYFFDMDQDEYRLVMQAPEVAFMTFCHHSTNEILIGNTSGIIDKVYLDEDMITGHFTEHIFPVDDIIFFSDDICLSYSKYEAWIWNCFNFESLHSLTLKEGLTASIFAIVPNREDLFLSVMSDCTIHLWRRESDKACSPRMVASYTSFEFMADKNTNFVDFSEDGTLMALAGNTRFVSLVDTSEEYWVLKRVIQLPPPANAAVQIKFIQLPMYFDAHKYVMTQCLVVFTLPDYELLLYDLEHAYYGATGQPMCFMLDVESEPNGFQLTEDYAVFRLSSGFVDVYTTFWWLNDDFCPWLHFERPYLEVPHATNRLASLAVHRGPEMERLTLASERDTYRQVLLHLGRLPPAERANYWRLGLIVPSNLDVYKGLLLSRLHPAVRRLSEHFPTMPKQNLFKLLRIYSTFCYLSPLFYLVQDLPHIILNFCKVLSWSPLAVLETILTVYNNFCHEWYADFPKPPVQNINDIYDIIKSKNKSLIKHCGRNKINIKKFAWTVMSNLFTKVLDYHKWCVLWDHIIFADKEFISMAVASLILNASSIFFQYEEDFDDFEEVIKNADIDIFTVILVAHDLNLTVNDPKSVQEFVPLPKEGFREFVTIEYPKIRVLNRVDNKLQEKVIEDICFQELIDSFKLLDPRPHHDLRKFLKKDDPLNSLLQHNAAQEETETGGVKDEKNKIREDIEKERRIKYKHLISMLEGREIHWINNSQIRLADRDRLKLLMKSWEYSGDVGGIAEKALKSTRETRLNKLKTLGKVPDEAKPYLLPVEETPEKPAEVVRDKNVRMSAITKKSVFQKRQDAKAVVTESETSSDEEEAENLVPEKEDEVVILRSGIPALRTDIEGLYEQVEDIRHRLKEWWSLRCDFLLRESLLQLDQGDEEIQRAIRESIRAPMHTMGLQHHLEHNVAVQTSAGHHEQHSARPRQISNTRATRHAPGVEPPDWRNKRREQFFSIIEPLADRIGYKIRKSKNKLSAFETKE